MFNIPEQEHILNTHIDHLAEWYADAERITGTNLPRIGDTLIFPYSAGGYAIEVEEDDWTPDDVVAGESARILARAPKPKPAWHDAVAVVANHRDYADERRTVWVQVGGDEYDRVNIEGDTAAEHHLVNVTPLIEAKVTDEMVKRIREVKDPKGRRYFASREGARYVLSIALGLEAE